MCVGPVDLGCDIYPSKLGTSSCGYDCVEKGSPGQFSDCESTDVCMCYRVEQCESGDACINTYGCIKEADARCESFPKLFKCGDNVCNPNQACCPWGYEESNDPDVPDDRGDCYSGGYYSCDFDTPSPENKNRFGIIDENRCKDNDDNDCDSLIDCADPDCASSTYCIHTYDVCQENKPCSVKCGYGDWIGYRACEDSYVSGDTCYYGGGFCCACFDYGTCEPCNGYGYCSYPFSTPTKQTSCPDKCEHVGDVPTFSTMVPAGSTANRCSKDYGWVCDYSSTAVDCCVDADCEAGVTVCNQETHTCVPQTCVAALSQSATPASPQKQGTEVKFGCAYTYASGGAPITGATCTFNIGSAHSTYYDSGVYYYKTSLLSVGPWNWYCECSKAGCNTVTGSTQTYRIAQCLTDADCTGLTCEADGYGARVKLCRISDYSCQCGPCSSNTDCVNQCCEKEINKDVNGDGKIEDCVSIGSVDLGRTYLCASASPVEWHECNAANFGKMFKDGDKSYICLTEENDYRWVETFNLKSLMSLFGFVFVAVILLKKRLKKKKH